MSAWRRALVRPSSSSCSLLVALGASAHAQFGNHPQEVPSPGTAKPPVPPPPAGSPKGFGDGVTPEQVDRLLKALKARVARYERAQAATRASKKADRTTRIRSGSRE